MFNFKSIAPKAILPVAGIALAAGVIGAAAPAKAFTIVDSFTNPVSLNDGVGGSAATSGPSSITSTVPGIQRSISLTATGTGLPATLDVVGGRVDIGARNGVSTNTLLTYTISPSFNFASIPNIAFNYDLDAGQAGSTVEFIFTLGTQTLSSGALTGNGLGSQVFKFNPAGLTNVTSASLQIIGGNSRDITFTSPITASVPVPPAILATGIGAVIGGLKAARKRQQQAVMA
jgi:hypothetical protein